MLTHIRLSAAKEAAVPRTIWLWDEADWPAMRRALSDTDWDATLALDVEAKVRALTSKLVSLQSQFVPHRQYLAKPTDPP